MQEQGKPLSNSDRLPSDRHRARYAHLGERFKAPTTFDAAENASAWLSGARTDTQRGKWEHPDAIKPETFKACALAWIEQRASSKSEHLCENAQAEYRHYLGKGLAYFSSEHLDLITTA